MSTATDHLPGVGADNSRAPRCPQWWAVFGVHGGGRRGQGEVYVISVVDVVAGLWRCTCPDFTYRRAGCKHIRAVAAHGCLAGPSRAAGSNDLARVGVAMVAEANRAPGSARRTGRRCVCGELMLSPVLRLADEAGRQVVRVRLGGRDTESHGCVTSPEYTYASGRELAVGDVVAVPAPSWRRKGSVGTGVGWGSDYLGELAVL